MMHIKRGALALAMLASAALLAGCSTMDDSGGIAANDQPGQVAPMPDSSVSSDTLPPIGASDGNVQVASSGLPPPSTDAAPQTDTGDPGLATGSTSGAATSGATGTAGAPGSFVSLNDVGQVSTAPGRDLTGGLTIEKLLGGWTVVSGATQCRLNLTYTAKGGDTDRYRASAPGCQMPTLGTVSSWQLSGTQVQLFDDSDKLVGTLLLSGNRFIGTLSGGQAISMVG
jgi:hypothetical protein